MKNTVTRRSWLKSSGAALASLAAAGILPESARGSSTPAGASKVLMTKKITPESLVKIYEALGRPASGRVAVKISTGEPGGHNFLQPSLIGDLVRKVNGTIVECNTAYGGKRSSTEAHMQAAKDHGFLDIAKVDIMDAEGEFHLPVKDKKHLQYDIVGDHLKNYDFMINLAHFKGHAMGGFGGVLKNQSIGVASAAGKAYIHSGWENAGRFPGMEQSGRAGCLSGIHGRVRPGGRGLLRGQDTLHQCHEQSVHRLRLRRPSP